MRFLGIDYGAKRVGIAVSDETGKLAFPYSVIANDGKLLEKITAIIEKLVPRSDSEVRDKIEIVMGESTNFQGEPNEIMKEIKEFKKELEEEIRDKGKMGVEIHFEPEFLTSQQAKQIQGENKMHDASAAAIILQSYLDRKQSVL